MTKQNSTKRALLMSGLALLMCVSMLIGNTFAWFTDSVTSGNNKIVAGTLDVQLLMNTGDGYKDISDSTSPIFGSGSIAQNNNAETLWEPGKTQVAYLAIKNNGNLALKYSVALNVQNVSKDLYEVMEYAITPDAQYSSVTSWDAANGKSVVVGNQTVTTGDTVMNPGDIHYFALSIHMNEAAGNAYQGGEVNFDLTVMAAQATVESDSFDNQYDADALYAVADGVYVEDDGSYVAMSMSGLSNVAALASADSSITSVTYVTDEGEVEVPVVSSSDSLDSAIAADNEIVVLTSGSYTVDNAKNTTVAIVGNGTDTQLSVESEGEYNTDYGFDGSSVTFENLVFNVNGYLNGYARMTATYNNCVINGTYTLNGASVFNNCTFNKTGDDYCVWTWGAPTAEFNNCTFNTDGKAILMYGGANTVLTMNDCVLNDSGAISGKAAIEVGSDWSTDTKEIIMTGCTVNGFDTTEAKTTTWGGTNLGTNVWGNKNLLPEDRLTVTIDGQTVYGN